MPLKWPSIALSTKVLWSQLSYLGIVFVGPLWLLFTLSYTANENWLKKKFIAILMIVPAIILLLVATNQVSGLIWPTIILSSNQPGALIIYEHGLGFYLNAAYTYILMFIGIMLLDKEFNSQPQNI